jgi:hypothetical protein
VNFDLFDTRPIPHHGGFNKTTNGRDWSHTSPILASHSEVPRSEYDYQWNSDGLRSVDFATKPRVVALGCSITLGQGLPVAMRWSDLLSKKLGEPVGNISYSGAAIMKDVSSFFGLVHTYRYLPEVVICNFANFQRLYFPDPKNEYMREYFLNSEPRVYKAEAPFEYGKILPFEWVYYSNLDHIKMLEAFCFTNNIKLIWSTWSTNLTDEMENVLSTKFMNYVPDITRDIFPDDFEYPQSPKSVAEISKHFVITKDAGCHANEKEEHAEVFDYAYDYHKKAGEWGPGSHWPHPGLHRHLHWSEFYYNELMKIDNTRS